MDNPLANLSHGQKIAVIVGSLAVGGVMVYKHHGSTGSWNPFSKGTSSTSAASATTSSTSIDPVTGLPVSQDNAIDPLTNMTYLAEAQQYGSVQAADSAFQYGQSVGGGGVPNYSAGTAVAATETNPTTGATATSTYTSNAAWSQAVQAGLSDIGYDPTTVATALGLYLTGTPMTADQANIVKTAIAEFGPAPVGNLQIILQPDKQPSTTTSGSTGTSASGGKSGTPAAKAPAKPGGVRASNVTSDSFRLDWAAVPGATAYKVRVTYQGALAASETVFHNYANVGGLDPNHTYTTHVAAANSAGTSSETNGPTVKTK